MKIKKNEIRKFIARRWCFTCGSNIAVIVDNEYLVFSYDTLIARYNLDTESMTYFNYNYYSKTTRTLQNIVEDELTF